MSRSKTLKSVTATTTENRETGEVSTIETVKKYSIPTTSEDFYMVFVGAMQGFFQISCLTDVKILAKLCERAEFNTGRVFLTPQLRKQIITELNIPTQTMSNGLNRLRGLNLITGERGTYQLNAKVFWKGDTNTRAALLKNKGKLVLTTQIEQ